MAKKKSKEQGDLDLLDKARKQFGRLHKDDEHNRERARTSLEFTHDIGAGQWDQADRDQRATEGRPCLTSNKLEKFSSSVANAERDQRTAGNVIPVDDEGDIETASIIAGILRNIEHASDAEQIYTMAGEQAIAGGFGFWRIKTEELDDSLDGQELFLVAIKNQFAVYLDPDGMFGFITEKMTKDEFEYQYPDAEPESIDTDTSYRSLWYSDEDDIYVREYFYKERVKTTIVQASLPDQSGQTEGIRSKVFEMPKDISEEEFKAQGWVIDTNEDGTEIKKTPKMFKVKWAKITASQVLERGEWAGKDIPIIEVQGRWVWFDGRCYKKSLTQGAQDDQRIYNYTKTSIVERYALAIKAPYLLTSKMIGVFKTMWDKANTKLTPYLQYEPDKRQPGGPKRELPPQISTGEVNMLEITNRDVEDTIGRYKSSFGQQSNERTGVAIRERAARSEFSTFDFPDNFRRAILESTRQLIDLIPKIYDTDRMQRIIGEDGKAQISVQINHTVIDEATSEKRIINDLSVGKYDVVEGLKLMSTRRQEQLAGMEALAKGNPQLGIILAPHIAKMLDWDGADKIAEEIKALTPAMLGIQPQSEEALQGVNPGTGA